MLRLFHQGFSLGFARVHGTLHVPVSATNRQHACHVCFIHISAPFWAFGCLSSPLYFTLFDVEILQEMDLYRYSAAFPELLIPVLGQFAKLTEVDRGEGCLCFDW